MYRRLFDEAPRAGTSRVSCVVDREVRRSMATQELGWIANFIWGIADDVLRDVYVLTMSSPRKSPRGWPPIPRIRTR
jgi:hypothetical protein